MKILHVTNHFYPCVGGIETYIFDLCRELIKQGHKSDVACLDTCSYSNEKLPAKEIIEGINVFRMPYLNLKYYKIALSVAKFIKDYDIIHVHGIGFFSDYILLSKIFHKKPVVVSGHGGIFHTKRLSFIKQAYFGLWVRLTLKLADVVIAESKNNLALFEKICRPVFIPYSIHFRDFSIKRAPKKDSLLFVGRISRNKRIDNLISTVFFLKKSIPDVKLYVVGGDWENIKKDLDAMTIRLGLQKNVVFCGEKRGEELIEQYARAEFFVSASDYEGFGISAIEAMAAGCIPVLNSIDSFRAFIEDGKNGFIVDFGCPEAAAAKISEIKNLPANIRHKLEISARNTAKQYGWAGTAKKIESVYGVLI